MDPVTTALAGASLRGAASLVASLIKGNAGKTELQRLAVQYWGCILFEMRRNIIRVAVVVDKGKPERGDSLPALEFSFYDSLIGDLARVAPMPLLTAVAGRVNADLRAIHRLVSAQIQAGAIPFSTQPGVSTSTLLNVGAAWRFHAEGTVAQLIKSYNDMVGAIAVDGESTYKDEWSTVSRSTLPAALPRDVPSVASASALGL